MSYCVKREPGRIDEYARMYAQLFKQLHSIHVPLSSCIPSALENMVKAVKHIGRYFDTAKIDLLLRIVGSIPQDDRLLHCDLQSKNAMIQNGEPMLIDMGEVGYGHPLIDLGNSYSSMVTLLGDFEQIIGLPQSLARELWNRMIGYYFEGADAVEQAHRIEQIWAISIVGYCSWVFLSDGFAGGLIRQCQDAFDERVVRHKDHLLAVCETFGDFSLQ